MIGVHINVSGSKEAVAGIERDIEQLEKELAYNIVDEAHKLMDETKSGRVYRRGTIKGRRTKQGIEAGLRASGKSRMVIGSRFHRASAPGEPLAKDSGRTYRDITVRRMARGSYRIRFGGWAGFWEFDVKAMNRRYTIMPAIEAAVHRTFETR